MSVIFQALEKHRKKLREKLTAKGGPVKRPDLLSQNRVRISTTGVAVVGGILAVTGILGYEWWKMEQGRAMAMAMAKKKMAEEAAIAAAKPPTAPAGERPFVPPDQGMGTTTPTLPPPPPPPAPTAAGTTAQTLPPPLLMAGPNEPSAATGTPPSGENTQPLPTGVSPPDGPGQPQQPNAQQIPASSPGEMGLAFLPPDPALSTPHPGEQVQSMTTPPALPEGTTPLEPADDAETASVPVVADTGIMRMRALGRLQQALDRGDQQRIEQELTQLESLLPTNDPYPLKVRAFQHLLKREYGQAEPLLRQVLGRTPQDVEAGINLASALQGLGRHDEARAILEEMVVRQPNHPALRPYRK